MNRKKQYTQYLSFNSLKVNQRVQRSVIGARVAKLVREWNFRSVGVITVSLRDGIAYIINGQHRWAAALELGHGSSNVLCHVYTDLTEREEAELFLALNDSRHVSPFDRYKIGLVAEDPVCVGATQMLARYGLSIGTNGADGTIGCVDKVLKLYASDPALLERVCRLTIAAWGTRATAFEQVVFSAMAMICGRYNGELDDAVFVKKIAGYRGGPAALAGDARGLADYKPITVTRAAAEIMVDTYNKGRRSGQLSPL